MTQRLSALTYLYTEYIFYLPALHQKLTSVSRRRISLTSSLTPTKPPPMKTAPKTTVALATRPSPPIYILLKRKAVHWNKASVKTPLPLNVEPNFGSIQTKEPQISSTIQRAMIHFASLERSFAITS